MRAGLPTGRGGTSLASIGRHRKPKAERGYLASVRATAITNLAITAVSAVMGIGIARCLGPAGRGAYAIVTSYTQAAATIGELGLTASICYFVARYPDRAADVVRTGGALLLALGVVVGAGGILAAPLVFPHDAAAAATFRVAFAAQPLIFVSGCLVFALQATRLPAWNLVRAVQPLVQAAVVSTVAVAAGLTIGRTVGGLLVSTAVQTAAAFVLWRRECPTRGRIRHRDAAELMRYGGAVFLSTVPFLLTAYLDVLILALLVDPAKVGLYAVAVSMSMLSQPICVAFGNVAMPLLARHAATKPVSDESAGLAAGRNPPVARHVRRTAGLAVGASLLSGTVVAGLISAAAPVLVPLLFGAHYERSIGLLWLLAPGAVLLGCNRVMDDLLRGLGRSLTVARCEGVGAVLTVVGLAVLVPALGIAGAAITSTAAYSVAFLFLLRALLRAIGVPVRAVPSQARGLIAIRIAGARGAIPTNAERR
ncbi:conserved membrane hypothetical protein [Frankia canadensis]|uniref:Uncharacterized protein n=1 Tax=Frankia canadensis TaxID=1836972 RepID=A0A2I2KZL0_9ACTN|nr:oligosaccharide flippase family protein [Frankia canadensis]SNQ51098.1 conserved membrane hypothetical protein [Frankia canadensis]SOU58388.1 conserved membrane hypothetical protein [Frankia canadensis]